MPQFNRSHIRIGAKLAAIAAAAVIFTSCSFDGAKTNIDGISPVISGYKPVAAETRVTITAEPDAAEETEVTIEKELTIEERADEILASMSMEEKIGQLLLARATENISEDTDKYHLGGITFYATDFAESNPSAFKTYTQQLSARTGVKPFFAVDEEGGTVVRVSKSKEFRDCAFRSPQDIFNKSGLEGLEEDTAEKAQLLTSIGLNLNLAPVADISDDKNSYIYDRTLGQNVEDSADGVEVIVRTAAENGIASCLKHFPGYGDNTDTHTDQAVDDRLLTDFYNRDFVVFSAGIQAADGKLPAVMIGHTIYSSIDEGTPASLSKVIHGVLRNKLGFDGVAITDDLGMDAIKEYAGRKSVYVMAVQADNDLLCVSDHRTAYAELAEAYNSGELTKKEIDKHVRRILIMKLQYGIIE